MDDFIVQLKRRKYLALCILIALALLGPAIIYVATVRDTWSFDIRVLGAERYAQRMNDSLKYALIMLGLISLLVLPLARRLFGFFDNIEHRVRSLSFEDFSSLDVQNRGTSLLNRYVPPFIISGEQAFFSTLFGEHVLYFKQTATIRISRVRHGYIIRSHPGGLRLMLSNANDLACLLREGKRINVDINIEWP